MKTFGLVLCSAVIGAAGIFAYDTWIKRPSPTPVPVIVDVSRIENSIDHIVDVEGTMLGTMIELDRGQSELASKIGELSAAVRQPQNGGCRCKNRRRCEKPCER